MAEIGMGAGPGSVAVDAAGWRAAKGGSQWRPGGEVACPCCQARYRVDVLDMRERAADFFRCDACGAVVDEWLDCRRRRFERA